MSKARTAYFCQNCGHESAKWLGKCPSCQQWNSFVEELIQKETKKSGGNDWQSYHEESPQKKIQALHSIKTKDIPRLVTTDPELNRVLGGGIVPGSLVLVAGEPGIGKSTLFLQMGLQLQETRTLYISGEESEQQIKMRAERLNDASPSFYILTETNTKHIFQAAEALSPGMLIIDSIQTLYSSQLDFGSGKCGTSAAMRG